MEALCPSFDHAASLGFTLTEEARAQQAAELSQPNCDRDGRRGRSTRRKGGNRQRRRTRRTASAWLTLAAQRTARALDGFRERYVHTDLGHSGHSRARPPASMPVRPAVPNTAIARLQPERHGHHPGQPVQLVPPALRPVLCQLTSELLHNVFAQRAIAFSSSRLEQPSARSRRVLEPVVWMLTLIFKAAIDQSSTETTGHEASMRSLCLAQPDRQSV
jgi:hypothetical protein